MYMYAHIVQGGGWKCQKALRNCQKRNEGMSKYIKKLSKSYKTSENGNFIIYLKSQEMLKC